MSTQPRSADLRLDSPPVSASLDRATLLAFLGLVLFAGANAVGVRVTVAELPPFWGATIRFGLAGAILVATTVALRRPFPRGERLLGASLFGLFGFGLAYMFVYVALQDAPAGTAQVMLSVVPLVTLFLARAQGIERIRRTSVIGALIATAGIAVVFADQISLEVPLLALGFLLATAVCQAESGIVAKRFPPGDPVAANAVGMLIGAAMLAVLSFVAGESHALPTRPETWLAIAYLVVFGSVAVFVLVLYVLARWSVSATSYAFLLFPLVTVALGAILLREPIQPTFLLGGAIVILGVYVGAVYRPRPAVTQPAPAAPPGSAAP
jgi:drug/metabolite transporter (DMT)-like permease